MDVVRIDLQRIHPRNIEGLLLDKQKNMVANGEMSADRLALIETAMPAYMQQVRASVLLIERDNAFGALSQWLYKPESRGKVIPLHPYTAPDPDKPPQPQP